jgi:hypothetical protein
MMKSARLDEGSMILDVTAGLGAAAKSLPELKNCEVRSFESNAALAEAALKINEIEVEAYDPANGGLGRKGIGKFAAILARDLMYTLEKWDALGDLGGMLLPEGVIVISDFVLAEGAKESKEMKRWREIEPARPQLWSVEQYRDSILKLNLNVKVLADETDVMHKIVKTSWNNCWNSLKSERLSRGMVDALAYEAELWMHRIRALESGNLQYIMAHAKSRDRKIRKLTN